LPILYNNKEYVLSFSPHIISYIIISSVSYHYTSIAAFDIMSLVSPITFSLLNIYKRIAIITVNYIYILEIPKLLVICGIIISNISLYYYLK